MKNNIAIGALVTFVAAAGCTTMPLKTESSNSAIRAAEEVGAADVPQASLYLQMAKEEVELAKKLSKNGDRERAVSMLHRADADAELAVMLSHSDAELQEAEAAKERVRQLRRDNP